MSTDLSASVRALTAGQGDPMTIGLAHSAYTDTEILEGVDVTLTDPDEKIEQERSRRLIRKVGVFHQEGQMDDTFTAMRMMSKYGSVVVRTPLRFTVGNDNALSLWVWNRSGSALTSGAVVEFDGNIYGRWLR